MRDGEAVYVYVDLTNCPCADGGCAAHYTTFKRYLMPLSAAEAAAFESRMATEGQAEAMAGAWGPL